MFINNKRLESLEQFLGLKWYDDSHSFQGSENSILWRRVYDLQSLITKLTEDNKRLLAYLDLTLQTNCTENIPKLVKIKSTKKRK